LSGPGAYRFGPIRDFLIGVRYIDVEGKVITAGGKVVKNSAGFDIPKFLIGSIGRLGVLVELTFKVFPEPEARSTFSFPANDPEQAAELMARFNRSFFDLEALDYLPDTNLLWGRLAGNAKAMNARLQRIGKLADGITIHERDRSNDFWQEQLDFSWIDPDLPLAKFAITASSIKRHDGEKKNFRFSLGGNTAWVNAPVEFLKQNDIFEMPGMLIRNPDMDGSIWTRQPKPLFKIQTALKDALDFPGKFPPFF